ncbi:hypothetical protein AVEN_105693-1 [Araneus ventricosus]|uniref:Uncharacterized protein n=1 Tax=Araneus ventricosus TaxID=182803 RepID=A0A4Y2W6Y3_ARAVE|nr:hypothetical protein AVEN_105693-1 [Araneus ventricosus]
MIKRCLKCGGEQSHKECSVYVGTVENPKCITANYSVILQLGVGARNSRGILKPPCTSKSLEKLSSPSKYLMPIGQEIKKRKICRRNHANVKKQRNVNFM